jgi:hypothetical protein
MVGKNFSFHLWLLLGNGSEFGYFSDPGHSQEEAGNTQAWWGNSDLSSNVSGLRQPELMN